MFHKPQTLDEAKPYRYGQWAGNPRGMPYRPDRCAYEVMERGSLLFCQCSRKKGHGPAGLYCAQHGRMLGIAIQD